MNKADKRQKLSSSSSDEDDDFGQKEDDFDLEMDEAERERFNQMSEKEREIEIFKRLEQREIMKTREHIKRKLEMAADKKTSSTAAKTRKKKHKISDDSDDDEAVVAKKKNDAVTSSDEERGKDGDTSDEDDEDEAKNARNRQPKKKAKSDVVSDEEEAMNTDYHKPSEVANKHNKMKAMADLLSKRRDKKHAEEKRKKEAQKAALDLDEIFGNNKKEDGKSSSSSSSSSTSSSRSSSPASSKSRTPSPVAEPIHSRAELVKCQAIRRRLARIVHAPFFAKAVIGCFVRVQIGAHDGRPTYRIAQVTDVVETAKIYEVEPGTEIRTNKGFRLKICNNEGQKVIRLEFVSNGEFMDSEYQFWLKRMQETDTPLPTVEFVERKQKELHDALNYNFTDAEINLMVREKQRFKRNPTNIAFQKAELLKQKEDAEQSGDTERVRDLQQQINDLEEKAKKIETQRNKSLSAITAINQRNRDHMKHIFLSSEHMATNEHSMVKDDDPFTRKSARMKLVTGGASKQQNSNAAGSSAMDAPSSSLSSNFASVATASLSANKMGTGGTNLQTAYSNDWFNAHGFEINVDLDKVLPSSIGNSFRTHQLAASTDSNHPANRESQKSAGSTRTLTLEEYKKKYSARMASSTAGGAS